MEIRIIGTIATALSLVITVISSTDEKQLEVRDTVLTPNHLSAFDKINLANSNYTTDNQLSELTKLSLAGKNVVIFKNVGFGVTGADNINVGLNSTKNITRGLIEIRLDDVNGPLVISLPINSTGKYNGTVLRGSVVPYKGHHDLYMIFSPELNDNHVSWFQFEVSGPDPNQYYILMSRMHSKAVTVEGASRKNGTFLRLFPFSYGTHQMFRFEKTANSSAYKVIARHSDMALEVFQGKYTEATVLAQAPYNGSQNQQWYLDTTADGTIKLMSRLTGRCMTVQNSSPNDNIYLVQNACLNILSQLWYIVPIC